jgi:hypothetical protein
MKKLKKNQRKNIFTKDYVTLSVIEPKISEEKRTSNITDTNYDLGHIYGYGNIVNFLNNYQFFFEIQILNHLKYYNCQRYYFDIIVIIILNNFLYFYSLI